MLKAYACLCFLLTITLGSIQEARSQNNECRNDFLESNSGGEFLVLSSGQVFETLAGDNIFASLWLQSSELLVCGPTPFSFRGQTYQIYEIANLTDGEKVTAMLKSAEISSNSPSGGCHKSSITKPAPFLGNDGEIFTLTDGSVWKVKYEYEYLYEYYPSIIACADQGYILVGDKKLTAEKIR